MSILVTGATGTIGTDVLRLFDQERRMEVKALIRNAEKAALVSDHGAEPVIGAFEDRQSLDSALQGVATVVLLTPAGPQAEEQASNVIEAAIAAGAQKIVRISAIKADPDGPTNNTRAHGSTEAEIAQSGLRHVFLRPNLFMQNMFIAADQIRQKAQFSFATGYGKMGMIDARDIAACAVECALSDFDGQTLELTGPEVISYFDVAGVMSTLLGKPISYAPVPPEDMYAAIEGAGWGQWMAALAQDYGQAYASGWGAFTSSNVQKITGKAPRSFRDFASEVFLPTLKTC
ncbi:SDR family oxidoreductase [Ruegeria arenilitoris]|uniref:SDR family oxidoreductase n=1 Tax=Ruegeria arenilitoris TaxID=1173585 RepID=UPI00147C3653|nr:SDR family oxidoreductase [Ruegeria arenilitoris]